MLMSKYYFIIMNLFFTFLFQNYFCYFYSYAGRPTAASAATGSKMQHLKELKALLDVSFAV